MTPRGKKILLQAGNFLAAIITILINTLAVLLPLNSKTTQELSDALPNLFVPAGITFSIWGVIYIFWIVFAIYQARDIFKKEEIEMPFLTQINGFFILSCFANSVWIFLWHYEYIGFSLLMMLVLLFSLLAIYIRLNIGRSNVQLKEMFFIHVPFSIYLGWITVATIANVTAFLVSIQWNGFDITPLTWTIIVIAVATFMTILMLGLRKDIAFSLVVLWAFLGIWIKQIQPIPATNRNVATTAILAMILIIIALVSTIAYQLVYKNKQKFLQKDRT